jgi:ferredoxin-NADP reductase
MPQKLRCRVEEIVAHGGQVYSLILIPEHPAPRFQPGQFLHLALDEYNPGDFWPDSRSFSIASAPAERDRLRITFAVKGRFSSRMEAELHPGRDVWVKLPYGEFIVEAGSETCLLAGGTGITAFTAFLSTLGPDLLCPITFFYGARRSDLLIYRPQVEAAAKICPRLHPIFLIEEGQDSGCLSGRIDLNLIWRSLSDPLAVTYYLSGPPVMLKTLSVDLAERGVARERVRLDAWE